MFTRHVFCPNENSFSSHNLWGRLCLHWRRSCDLEWFSNLSMVRWMVSHGIRNRPQVLLNHWAFCNICVLSTSQLWCSLLKSFSMIQDKNSKIYVSMRNERGQDYWFLFCYKNWNDDFYQIMGKTMNKNFLLPYLLHYLNKAGKNINFTALA